MVEPTRIFSVTRNETGVTCGPSDVMSSDVMQTASSGETFCHKPSDPTIKYLAAQFEWNLRTFGNIAIEIQIAAKMKHQCTQKNNFKNLDPGTLEHYDPRQEYASSLSERLTQCRKRARTLSGLSKSLAWPPQIGPILPENKSSAVRCTIWKIRPSNMDFMTACWVSSN